MRGSAARIAALVLLPALAAAAPSRKIAVELGKEFVLRPEQTAAFKGTDASVRITGFIDSPCPKGVRCIWSGQAVNLELTVAGSTVALDGSAPYAVAVLASDYRTRATLKATRRPAPRPKTK